MQQVHERTDGRIATDRPLYTGCQISKMEPFVKIVNDSILNVWQGSEYTSGYLIESQICVCEIFFF